LTTNLAATSNPNPPHPRAPPVALISPPSLLIGSPDENYEKKSERGFGPFCEERREKSVKRVGPTITTKSDITIIQKKSDKGLDKGVGYVILGM